MKNNGLTLEEKIILVLEAKERLARYRDKINKKLKNIMDKRWQP